jgi:hypothetical protein
MQQITELHREILGNINVIQNKTSKILIEQESDIRRFFLKKINEIKEKFKEDRLSKNEKDQESFEKNKQMMSELEWIKNIAHKIDIENQTLIKKYSFLKSEYDIQEKDKNLLMKELLMKKKENAVLKSQVEQYEKLLNEVSKEMEENDLKASQSLTNAILEPTTLKPEPSNPKPSPMDKPQKNTTIISNSRLTVNNEASSKFPEDKLDKAVAHLNNIIAKEKKRVRDLKTLYMREIGSKSELEKIVRKLVEDVRNSILETDGECGRKRGTDGEFSQQAREKLLEQLLSNEKILMLVYDRMFHGGSRPLGTGNIPEELSKIVECNE